jgi:hypothetical protein
MRTTANLVTLIRLEPVKRKFVFLRPDRNRFYAKLIGGTKNTDRYL